MGFKNPKPGSSETKFLIAVNKLTRAIVGKLVMGETVLTFVSECFSQQLVFSYLYCHDWIGLMGEGRTVSAISGECLIDS